MKTKTPDKMPAADWMNFFVKADVLTKALADTRSAKGKMIKIGQFLTPNVNRTVPIQVDGRSGHATLRVETKKHGKEKRYFFEVVWDASGTATKKKPEKKAKPKPEPAVPAPTATKASSATSSTHKKPAPKVKKPGNDEAWD